MVITLAMLTPAQDLLPVPPGTEMVPVTRPTKKGKANKHLPKKHQSGYEKQAITRQK